MSLSSADLALPERTLLTNVLLACFGDIQSGRMKALRWVEEDATCVHLCHLLGLSVHALRDEGRRQFNKSPNKRKNVINALGGRPSL